MVSQDIRRRPLLARMVVLIVVALPLTYVVVRTQVIDQVLLRWSYAVEKGRLNAIRESVATQPAGASSGEQVRQVAALVSPAVVSITANARIPEMPTAQQDGPIEDLQEWLKSPLSKPAVPPDDEAHRDLRRQREGMDLFSIGWGSGFVIDETQGHVLTCNHVIENAEKIEIQLADGRRLPAKLLGADPKTDVALLAVEPLGLHAIRLGDSESINVGDDVLAVGSPFRLGGSFSKGIVSAKGRVNLDLGAAEYAGFIQTDAVINPGNSGGPLVNMRGEVVGMAIAIASRTGVSDGVGFAIPASRIRRLLPMLAEGSTIPRGYLGVEISSVHAVRDEAGALGWNEPYGVLIGGVLPGSPAERAGLRKDDIVVEYKGQMVPTTVELMDEVAFTKPGEQANLKIWRDKGWSELILVVDPQPTDFHTYRTIRPRP